MHPVPVKILTICSMFLLALLSVPVPAQMSSTTANYAGILNYYTDTVMYPGYPRTDPYFVFHAPVHGVAVTGTLRATPPGGTPGFDFSWSRYDPVAGDFGPPFFSQSGVPVSMASNLEEGCYRVHITSMDLDTMLRAWVFPNDPSIEVEKGPDGKVMPYRYTCDYLVLSGRIFPQKMTYYDLATGHDTILPNGMSFEWTSDDPEYKIYGASSNLTLTIYKEQNSGPPTKDTRFYLTAVDSFGLTRMDDVLYESVHVRAGFTMFYEERSGDDGEGTWTESDKPEEESPLEVHFHNLSENGVEFVWTLVDSAKTGEDAIVTTIDVNDSVVYTYYVPDYYYPRITAYSEAGCVDSFPLTTSRPEIHVVPSELDAPNVFTPNGDGVNDYFVVRAKSLKFFRITIYDRSGRKIYEYEHKDGRMEWEGWDGSIQGKGKNFAEPGVYYYVIDALGWDATVYRKVKPYTGFVYLFREKE
jgi:gliding motility-associated-like protein